MFFITQILYDISLNEFQFNSSALFSIATSTLFRTYYLNIMIINLVEVLFTIIRLIFNLINLIIKSRNIIVENKKYEFNNILSIFIATTL